MYFFLQEFTALFYLITPNTSAIILRTSIKVADRLVWGDEGNLSLTEGKADTVNKFLMTTTMQYLQEVIITMLLFILLSSGRVFVFPHCPFLQQLHLQVLCSLSG